MAGSVTPTHSRIGLTLHAWTIVDWRDVEAEAETLLAASARRDLKRLLAEAISRGVQVCFARLTAINPPAGRLAEAEAIIADLEYCYSHTISARGDEEKVKRMRRFLGYEDESR